MTSTATSTTGDVVAATTSGDALRARPAGLVHDVAAIAGRALRGVPRDLAAVAPPVFIALFFFIVNIATLERLTRSAGPGFDYKAFQMPTAILLGVTGISRAPALVLDVQNGYLDRLLMTPIRRLLRRPPRAHTTDLRAEARAGARGATRLPGRRPGTAEPPAS